MAVEKAEVLAQKHNRTATLTHNLRMEVARLQQQLAEEFQAASDALAPDEALAYSGRLISVVKLTPEEVAERAAIRAAVEAAVQAEGEKDQDQP